MKNMTGIIQVATLWLFSLSVQAVSVTDALEAEQDGNESQAVKIWANLADQGNAVAQYNLALHYQQGKGIEKNPLLANAWYKDAAQKGLVSAYLKLNNHAVKPAQGISVNLEVGPQFWLGKQNPDRYTIQLVSSRYKDPIMKMFEKNNLKGRGGFYQYSRNGIERYALIYGSFRTVAEAKAAMSQLPAALREKTPWVRKIRTLQNISQ